MEMALLLLCSRDAALLNINTRSTKQLRKLTGDSLPVLEGYLHSLAVGKGVFVSLGNKNECTSIVDAFLLTVEIEQLRIERLPDMRVERSSPGVILLEERILVFGGVKYPKGDEGLTILSESEALSLSPSSRWSPLASMLTPRAFFTPCEYLSDVYLCGGLTLHCERYSPATNSYTQLWISLQEFDGHGHCTFMYQGEMIILSKNWMMKWKPEGVETVEYEIEGFGDVMCNVGPVVCGEDVLFGTSSGMRAFKVETMEGHTFMV